MTYGGCIAGKGIVKYFVWQHDKKELSNQEGRLRLVDYSQHWMGNKLK